MSKPEVINPGGQLLTEIEAQLFLANKTKPLWAKQLDLPQEVVSLEGRERVEAGDYLCRGVQGEQWPQKARKLLSTYIATAEKDDAGWQRFDPKPDAAPVQAAQMKVAFRVQAHWGELSGKANDYVVRSTTDPTDVWIVDRTIFEASYVAKETTSGTGSKL